LSVFCFAHAWWLTSLLSGILLSYFTQLHFPNVIFPRGCHPTQCHSTQCHSKQSNLAQCHLTIAIPPKVILIHIIIQNDTQSNIIVVLSNLYFIQLSIYPIVIL